MAGRAQQQLYELAEDQHGFVTSEDAIRIGWPARRLAGLASRGTLERWSYGVYRLVAFPPSQLDGYVAATLWPVKTRGVISHESVLELLELCDVNPTRIHMTLPRQHRIRRAVPASYEIHHAELATNERSVFEGIPLTTVDRAIRDCVELGTGRHLLADAVERGRQQGWLTEHQCRDLKTLLGHLAQPDQGAGA